MGRLRAKCDYESLRDARISENMARMASLGLNRSAGELRSIISSAKSIKTSITIQKSSKARELRRSGRLSLATSSPQGSLQTPRRSDRLKGLVASTPQASVAEKAGFSDPIRRKLFSGRCENKSRGSIYDPVLGICCHFCRQKKLCGEEDCKRCGDGDMDQPCIGKTECSVCHSTNGVLCRACLKVRYGEEMEEVRMNKEWMCPHCIEERGINPYWICNSSFCLKKRKMVPTGIAIYQVCAAHAPHIKAREQGYKSVAHLLMDKLKRKAGHL